VIVTKEMYKGNHESVSGRKIMKYSFKYDYPQITLELLQEELDSLLQEKWFPPFN
jgi:hypothetical protein